MLAFACTALPFPTVAIFVLVTFAVLAVVVTGTHLHHTKSSG